MRADIEKYLGTVPEATAKVIADKIGVDRLHVARELNTMVSSGIVERRMQAGKSKVASEYVYWLSSSKAGGVEMHPTRIPASATFIQKTMNTNECSTSSAELLRVEALREQNVALQDQLSIVREALESEKEAHARTRSEQSSGDAGATAMIRAELDREKEAHAINVKELNKVIEKLDASEKEAKTLRARCASLQTQLDQYDERRRFETWFGARPENSGQPSIVREAMWESWLERSKMVEVAA
ncbi:hypothetical protein [Paraburkholderia sp. C35]|uniref:hypothetical protein n=1 Tax=Paraburkholderia sp. C35 TaxID=2126993 RepID=UPI000D694503|nr:hypothetical protein [Paraburkholderia sp. C35]